MCYEATTYYFHLTPLHQKSLVGREKGRLFGVALSCQHGYTPSLITAGLGMVS
jgi:hypothetical protein